MMQHKSLSTNLVQPNLAPNLYKVFSMMFYVEAFIC